MTRNQAFKNQQWEINIPTQIGLCTILTPPHVPTNLPRPYQYELTTEQSDRLLTDIRQLLQNTAAFQCNLVQTKTLKHGIRLEIFLLSYQQGFTGNNTGITKTAWNRITKTLRLRLQRSFGANVPLYIEDWTTTDKFQLRFQTYIKYTL